MNLQVHHLRAIVALADCRSFTMAAAQLGVAQSSLSRTVLEAERRLRTTMFERSTRRVLLTTDGEAVVAVARGVIQHVDAGLKHIEGYLAGTRGSVTVATLPSLAATLLPPVLRRYRELQPDVVLHVEDNLSGQVAAFLRSGQADLALTADPDEGDDYVVRPVAEDSFLLAVHPDHPYASAESVNWSDLQAEQLIAFGSASSVQRAVSRALREADVTPETIVRAQNVAAVAGLAASGLGVAPVPGFVLPLMRFAGLSFVPLVPRRARSIALVHSRGRPLSPAVRSWVEVMLQHLRMSPPAMQGVRWIRS